MVGQRPSELTAVHAAERQRRWRRDVEPADAGGLERRGRLDGNARAAQEKQLVNVNRQGWRIVLELTVPAGDQLDRRALIPGLFENLPGDRGRGRVPRVGPAARQ